MQAERNPRSNQSNDKMNLNQIGDAAEKEKTVTTSEAMTDQQLDPGSCLQMFLDHIPVSSIPRLRDSPVGELKTGQCVRDAIQMLYEKNAYGALISDVSHTDDTTTRKFSDRYVGFISCANMVLWCLEECKKSDVQTKLDSLEETTGNYGFFTMLEQNPHIGQTKIGELAKSFLWDSFLPVKLDDTLFHVLLILSNHRLQVVPVIQGSNSKVIGFVTQHAVIDLLLQSSGLEWFDNIADKALSEFRLEIQNHTVSVYEDQSISDAVRNLWESQTGAVAVVSSDGKRLSGTIRSSDICMLLKNDKLLHSRESLTVKEFIHTGSAEKCSGHPDEQDLKAPISAGTLLLQNSSLPRMDSPVANKKTDTLKKAMKDLAENRSSFSFIVNDYGHLAGMLTLRDIIIQFAPPCVDSNIHGAGFFESALQQTGCRITNGIMVRDNK